MNIYLLIMKAFRCPKLTTLTLHFEESPLYSIFWIEFVSILGCVEKLAITTDLEPEERWKISITGVEWLEMETTVPKLTSVKELTMDPSGVIIDSLELILFRKFSQVS